MSPARGTATTPFRIPLDIKARAQARARARPLTAVVVAALETYAADEADPTPTKEEPTNLASTEQAYYAIVDALGRTLVAPIPSPKIAGIRASGMERAGKVDPTALPLQVVRCTKSGEPWEPSR